MVNRRAKDLRYLAGFLAVLVLLHILSSFLYARFDFTKEKRYTLSAVTKEILKNLPGEVQVTVYLEGELPAGFKRLRSATRDLLADFKTYSMGNLRFNFVNPSGGTETEKQQAYEDLISRGVTPTNLSVKTDEGLSQKVIFPAALLTCNGRQFPVQLLQNRMGASPDEVLNNSIQNLEYAFASAIKKLTSGGKPRVGFTEGHGELSDLQLSSAMKLLDAGYETGRVDLKTITFSGLDKLRVLIIPKPNTAFTEAEKYKIDYFLMQGGSLFWAIDHVNAELDSLRGQESQLAFPKKLNLDDQLFRYGARVNYDLIADMNCAQIPLSVGNAGGQPQIQLVPWLFYPIFIPMSVHPVVRNLDGIRSEFASTVDTLAVKGVKSSVLLSTSPFSQLLNTPAMISLEMAAQEPDPKAFQSQPRPVAVLLEGSFSSAFKNRPVPEGITQEAVIPEKSKPAKMIVTGDGDVLKNQVSSTDSSPFPLGYDRYTQQQYGNSNFLLNAVDYLADDSGIITLRNKEVKLRLLDKARIKTEKLFWQLVNFIIPLGLLTVLGIFQHYRRRGKYAR